MGEQDRHWVPRLDLLLDKSRFETGSLDGHHIKTVICRAVADCLP